MVNNCCFFLVHWRQEEVGCDGSAVSQEHSPWLFKSWLKPWTDFFFLPADVEGGDICVDSFCHWQHLQPSTQTRGRWQKLKNNEKHFFNDFLQWREIVFFSFSLLGLCLLIVLSCFFTMLIKQQCSSKSPEKWVQGQRALHRKGVAVHFEKRWDSTTKINGTQMAFN